MTDHTLQVAMLLYDDVELLDVSGPLEVLSVANRLHLRASSTAPLFEITTVADRARPVRTRGVLTVVAGAGYDDVTSADVVLVPGGVTGAAETDERLLDWLRSTAKTARICASICNGALLLVRAGLLADGDRVTTHWEDAPLLRLRQPTLDVDETKPWIDIGRVITSAGISAGIDMTLHLVSRVGGYELASRTARQMVYPWRESTAPSASAG